MPLESRGLIPHAKKLFFAACVPAFLFPALRAPAQPVMAGAGTNLTSIMYYDPPNDRQMKLKLSGAEMKPLPGVAVYDVKQLKIETYSTNGMLQAVARAPQCTYAPLDEVASSTGHLELTWYGGKDTGKLHVQGEGFQWQQNGELLVISNRQQTLINMGHWKLTTP